jgi:hypothetical protein
VYAIREQLATKGMEQNPCLEGTDEAADEPFLAICVAQDGGEEGGEEEV